MSGDPDLTILDKQWTVQDAKVASCPTVLNGRRPQIIVGTTEGDVVSYDGSGRELWRVGLGGCVSAWPVAMDLPELGKIVLASNEDGTIACISPKGGIRWKREIEAPVHPWNSISAIYDRGEASILVTDREGRATALGQNSTPRWRFHTREGGIGPAAVGDIDGDGRDEIFFTSGEGRMYCLDVEGRFRWKVDFREPSEYSSPVLADLGQGPRIFTGSADDFLRCISPAGRVIWEEKGPGIGTIEVGLSLADIDGDGYDELVYAYGGTGIQARDGEGNLLWSRSYGGGDQPFGPTIADVDGDGCLELLLSQRDGPTFRVLTDEGQLLEEHELHAGMLGGPVIADVDCDGLIEVIAMSRKTGQLNCYSTRAPFSPRSVPWPNSRGGFNTRGSRLKEVPRTPREARRGDRTQVRPDTGDLHLGMNPIGFSQEGRWRSGRSVEVGLREQTGFREIGVIHQASHVLDLELLDPGKKSLEVRMLDSRGREMGRSRASRVLSPFKVEIARARGLLDQLQKIGRSDPELDGVIRKRRIEWTLLGEDMGSYADLDRNGRRDLIERVSRFLDRLNREVQCQSMRYKMEDRPAFLAWGPRHPWTAFDPEADCPAEGSLGTIKLLTDGRGHEATAVQVANMLSGPLSIRTWLDPLESAEGEKQAAGHLVLRRVAWVPTASGSMGADALPELGNAGLVQIEPSSSERIWIDVSTGRLPPGDYRTALHIRALVPEGSVLEVPIRWTVADTALPAELPLKFCNWGYVHSSPLRDIQEASIRDMQEHHTSVFVLTGEWTPRAIYDENGGIVDVDWQRFDWFLDRLRSQDMVLLIGGTPAAAGGKTDEDSPEWDRALRSFLPLLVKRFAEHGLGYDRWAFYPVDEPGLFGGRLIDILERRARSYKSADPRIQVYTDPVRGMRLGEIRRVLSLVDIFQPNFNGIVKKPTMERIDYLRSTGKTLWTYECAGGVKDMVGVKYYWEPIWTAWELGMTGVGFWSYCTRPDDLWQGPNPRGNDWELVYQGDSRPVPSVRWQAVRIAIEDYARLHALRELAGRLKEGGLKQEAKGAEKLILDSAKRARRTSWDPEVIRGIRGRLIRKTERLASMQQRE